MEKIARDEWSVGADGQSIGAVSAEVVEGNRSAPLWVRGHDGP